MRLALAVPVQREARIHDELALRPVEVLLRPQSMRGMRCMPGFYMLIVL